MNPSPQDTVYTRDVLHLYRSGAFEAVVVCHGSSRMSDWPARATPEGVVDFVKLIPDGRTPKRADRSAAGYLPGRAMRFCDAMTTATGYGYWIFPPADIQLLWDGEQIHWSFDDTAGWLPLSNSASGAVQFPDFANMFDAMAPEPLRGYSPPFLTALPEVGGVQIWTGLLARTKPGWSLSVRSPVNLPPIPGLVAWEGIVESDHWFGPLFSNFRMTRTDVPVRIRAHAPFLQVQPVPQIAYREAVLNQVSCRSANEMTEADWSDFGNVVLPSEEHAAQQGTYAIRLRKRRGCPEHAALLRKVIEAPKE